MKEKFSKNYQTGSLDLNPKEKNKRVANTKNGEI